MGSGEEEKVALPVEWGRRSLQSHCKESAVNNVSLTQSWSALQTPKGDHIGTPPLLPVSSQPKEGIDYVSVGGAQG